MQLVTCYGLYQQIYIMFGFSGELLLLVCDVLLRVWIVLCGNEYNIFHIRYDI